MGAQDQEHCFGPFRLVPARRLLLEDGQVRRLGSRAFDLLVALCQRAGEVVSNQDLLAAAWPNRVVEEGSLRVHIAALRKVLGDGQDGHRYISNVPLRGYCFVAPLLHGQPAEAGAPAAAPPIPAATSLPPVLTRLVGRDETIAELTLRLPQRRCITLVGPGGMGKTSVALEVARQLAETRGHEVVLVELAALQDPALVPQALASVLGIVVPVQEPVAALAAYLREKSGLLLVLDNCEHLIAAVAELAERLLLQAPGIHLLATSREALRIQGEWVQRLASLRLPPPQTLLSAEQALGFAAVQLFAERVAAQLDGFVLRDEDVAATVQVCRDVDGIPLAIELAASAVGMLGLGGLAQGLGGRLSRLGRGRRTALPRHQTLRATLDWSFGLLSPAEQDLLLRLSVFRGMFSRAAAAAVSAAGPGLSTDEALAGLVGKSLLVAEVQADQVLYRLLETTRAHAAEQLAATGLQPELAARHARHMLAQLRDAERERDGQVQAGWAGAHARSIDDLRAAVAWAFSPAGDVVLGVALLAWSAPLWFALSLMAEFRGLSEQALAAIDAGAAVADEDSMRLCEALGHALWHTRGGGPAMAACFRRALGLAERLGATAYRLRCLWGLWLICNTVGDYAGSKRLAEEFGLIAAASPESGTQLTHERMMSLGLHYHGEQARARMHAERVLQHPLTINHTARNSGFQFDQRVAALTVMARILWCQGFADQALRRAQEAVDEALAIDHALSLCYAVANGCAPVAFWVGDLAAARRYTDLLQQRADERSLYFWQAFASAYRLLLDLQDGQTDPPSLSALQHPAMGTLLRETLCTVQPSLADEALLARGLRNEAGWCTPELLRLQGEREQAAGRSAAAQALFERGIVLAAQQQALGWELRCTTSLARSLEQAGERTLAHQRLQRVLCRFSEGALSADLRQASELIRRWQ